MKTNRFKCPSCGQPYPLRKLIIESGWRMRCPECDTRLRFSTRSSQRMGAIAGLTFGVVIAVSQIMGVGFDFLLKWPNILWFMLFALVYGRILSLIICSLDVAPRRMSFDLFPNQRGVFKFLLIVGVVGTTIFALSGLWKRIPMWADITIQSVFFICLVVGLANNLFGRKSVLRSKDHAETESEPPAAD